MSLFFQKAFRGLNLWFYYIMGVIFVAVGYLLGQIPLAVSMLFADGQETVIKIEQSGDFSSSSLGSNTILLLMIFMFVVAFFALLLALRIQKKKLLDITTGRDQIDFNRVLFGFSLWMVLTIVFEFAHYLYHPEVYTLQFNFKTFVVLALIAIFMLPIQTSFEECFFRGYLMQGLSLLFKNKIGALVVTSILFSLVHSLNPEIEKYGFWNMQVYYIGAGLFLGLLVIVDDGLELALGVHAATNIFGALFVSYEGGVLQTQSIWKTAEINVHIANVLFYICAVLFYLICRKKFKWHKELEILTGRIEKVADKLLNTSTL